MVVSVTGENLTGENLTGENLTGENLIGEYLSARRELVSPQDVGLPDGGRRRRVPGLRRSEVALLAGVSADYYVRLEQGRDQHPSEQVLYADWEMVTEVTAAGLRALVGPDVDDPRLNELVGELSVRSERFRQLWARHDAPQAQWHDADRPSRGGPARAQRREA